MANPPDIDVEIGPSEPSRSRRNPSETGFSADQRNPAEARSPVTLAPEGPRVADAGFGLRPALPEADRVADTIDLVARQVGRVIGYVRSRTPAEMRADAGRALVDNAALSLAAALGLGYLVGRQVRR